MSDSSPLVSFFLALFILLPAIVVIVLSEEKSVEELPPLWPSNFNATLAQVYSTNGTIQWGKFYYSYDESLPELSRSRYDFYTGYIEPFDLSEARIHHTMYLINTTVWFYYPEINECFLRSTTTPSVAPDWLSSYQLRSFENFRGIYAQYWFLPEDPTLQYINRAEKPDRLPMRSTYQLFNESTATDFYDVVVGDQDPLLWELPELCLQNVTLPITTPQIQLQQMQFALVSTTWINQ
mmetsp:Transcript_15358/g.22996  ORF Transcript_15358/g.22996 Transcript_15358/m.22996 type:complete len:237 (-) Transcript_15358:23-733(-)